MNDWKSQLSAFDTLLKQLRDQQGKSSKLRFNRSIIIASDIAEQFYCEKKVEMEYLHGEVETEAKNIGTEAHENLTEDSVRVKREELWRKIHGAKPVFALEMFILARHDNVVLGGKPDSVLFMRGFPLVVFEYKFSRSSVDYRSYHVQAQTYGVLLGNMVFDTRRLFYAIVVADPKTRGSRELRQKVVRKVGENGPREAVLSIDCAKIYFCKFNCAQAEKVLAWALEFWNLQREAESTSNQNKCARCEYQTHCQDPTVQTPSSSDSIC
jgi:CRISPR/Cas system-associated exonuclease Cas4 (RecB family)